MEDRFTEFLKLSEMERLEYLLGSKFSRWDKFKCKLMSKWWTYTERSSRVKDEVLWNSIWKGRY